MSHFKPDISTYSDMIDIDTIKSTKNPTKSTKNSIKLISDIKTNSWIYNSHNINITYTPDNSIYFIIVNNLTFVNYERTIRDGDLCSPLNLEKFYFLITNCFNSKEFYHIDWKYEPSTLNITFSAILDGFFNIIQTISLDEKVLSNEKVLTIKLTEMKTKHQEKINELKQEMFELKNTPIIFAHEPNRFGKFLSYSPLTPIFDFTKSDSYQWHGNYMDFNKLKELRKIIIFNSNFKYMRNVFDYYYGGNDYNNNFKGCYSNSLQNIFDTPLIYIPSVIEIEVIYKDNSPIPSSLRSLPNLSKLSFYNFSNNVLSSFDLIKAIPKLTHLVYNLCLNIQNLDQIKNWCDSKNIKLEIK